LDDVRTVGSDELDARLLQDILDLDHVVLRDVLGVMKSGREDFREKI
jgi:hypothetical protein